MAKRKPWNYPRKIGSGSECYYLTRSGKSIDLIYGQKSGKWSTMRRFSEGQLRKILRDMKIQQRQGTKR